MSRARALNVTFPAGPPVAYASDQKAQERSTNVVQFETRFAFYPQSNTTTVGDSSTTFEGPSPGNAVMEAMSRLKQAIEEFGGPVVGNDDAERALSYMADDDVLTAVFEITPMGECLISWYEPDRIASLVFGGDNCVVFSISMGEPLSAEGNSMGKWPLTREGALPQHVLATIHARDE